jgi:hypothetical protein
MPRDRVASITRLLTSWYEAQQTGNVAILDELQREGVTHLYFGPRNATPLRQAIAASPLVARIYAEEGVEIYAFRSSGTDGAARGDGSSIMRLQR